MQGHPNVAFGGGLSTGSISPVGLTVMILAILLMWLLPRKYAIAPYVIFLFIEPLGQQFNVGGLHLFAERIVILCGCARFLFFSRPLLAGGWRTIDKIFVAWALVRVTAIILLAQQSAAVINQAGFLWDTLGGYFLVRCLIRDTADVVRVVKVFVWVAVLMAAAMLYEHFTLRNFFGQVMGGRLMPDIRDGRVRCRGVFLQEIIASTFGGTLIPLFLWLWYGARKHILAVVGVAAAVIIAITAASSTGVCAAAVGVGTLCLWPMRKKVRLMLWGLVAGILLLAVVMKAPVWFVIAHVDFAGGSTGWDRANLIDQCIRHFSSWWLVGTTANDTWGFSTWDLCNQFAAEAVQGGLFTFVLFILLIRSAFREIGSGLERSPERASGLLLWAIGCTLCAHIGGFFGISYFDQIEDWWFITLAMAVAACSSAHQCASIKTLVKNSAMRAVKPVRVRESIVTARSTV